MGNRQHRSHEHIHNRHKFNTINSNPNISFLADLNWTIVDGTWNVENNTLFGSGSTEALITADNTTQTNYEVTMTTIINGGLTRNESSVVVRYVDANNFYWMGVGCFRREFSIGRMLNGVPTEIASYGFQGICKGTKQNKIH
jgi:hypothetical protein